MPHLTLEYSANLEPQVDFSALTQALKAAMMSTGLFELGAIRVRAFSAPYYAIADDLPQNAFIDASLRIGTGRSQEDKKRVGEALFAVLNQRLMPLLAEPYFALSLEVREIDTQLSWKNNAIHPRMRGA